MIDLDIFNKEVVFQGVKGVIFIGEKMLVYRRDTKTDISPLQIDLPGGGRENNESPFDTFKRETHEEFGVEITPDDIQFCKKYQGAINPNKKSYFFITKPLPVEEKDIVFGNEGVGFFLMKPEEYLNLEDGIPRQQKRVREYLKELGFK